MEQTVEQLKVQAYDLLAAIQFHQQKLGEVNQLIAQKSQGNTVAATPSPEIITDLESKEDTTDVQTN